MQWHTLPGWLKKIYIDSPVNIVIILEGDVNIVGLVWI